MPLLGQTLEFVFAFYKDFALFTPSSVSVQVWKPDNSPLSPGSATAIATGLLRYAVGGPSVDAVGLWKARATSADVTVDLPEIVSAVEVRSASDGGGGGGDPFEIASAVWGRPVPASFSEGTAGHTLALLRSGGKAVVAAPVAANNDVYLYIAKDNAAAIGTSLVWHIEGAPGWAASATWRLSCRSAGLDKALVYDAGTLTLTLTAAETALFRPGLHRYEIFSVSAGLKRRWFTGIVYAEPEL
jgi:hypothetical protein